VNGEGGIRPGTFLQPAAPSPLTTEPLNSKEVTLSDTNQSGPIISGPFASKLAQNKHKTSIAKKGRPQRFTGRTVRLIVIYVRFSTDMQRSESCDDQVRKVREYLTQLGIDPTTAMVIRDEAVSGTTSDRPGLNHLNQLLQERAVQIVAVDELSRLTRSSDAASRIEDMVFEGVRFISVFEQIDTDRDDWQLKSQFLGMHNNMAVREIAHRVRRGQEGRVLDNGSAGDFGFGYTSYFLDGIAAVERMARGPKPKKGIRILESEAAIVRKVYDWFLDRWSIGKITRNLNEMEVDKGHRASKPGWHHQQVRRMLSNSKYVGIWTWGKTTTKRHSKNKKRQVPASSDQILSCQRPDLRIIEQSVWDRAQKRLKDLHEKFGWKEHQGRRGPRAHYTDVYPKTVLGGLVYCGECHARLHQQAGGSDTYYGCPNHRKGTCKTVARVPLKRGERVLLEYLTAHLDKYPEWLEAVRGSYAHRDEVLSTTAPHEIEQAITELDKLKREIKNLTDAVAQAGISDSISTAIRERQHKLAIADERLNELQRANFRPKAVPDSNELEAGCRDLASVFKDNQEECAQILRKFIDRIYVYEIPIPGKKRGNVQFRFHLCGECILSHMLQDDRPPLDAWIQAPNTIEHEECIILDVTTPTKMDKLGVRVAEMRAGGATWREITQATGLAAANAEVAMKRHTSTLKKSG
jgi:site-specific DNA recombinase